MDLDNSDSEYDLAQGLTIEAKHIRDRRLAGSLVEDPCATAKYDLSSFPRSKANEEARSKVLGLECNSANHIGAERYRKSRANAHFILHKNTHLPLQ